MHLLQILKTGTSYNLIIDLACSDDLLEKRSPFSGYLLGTEYGNIWDQSIKTTEIIFYFNNLQASFWSINPSGFSMQPLATEISCELSMNT